MKVDDVIEVVLESLTPHVIEAAINHPPKHSETWQVDEPEKIEE